MPEARLQRTREAYGAESSIVSYPQYPMRESLSPHIHEWRYDVINDEYVCGCGIRRCAAWQLNGYGHGV